MNNTFIMDTFLALCFILGYSIMGIFTGIKSDYTTIFIAVSYVILLRLSKIYDLLKQRQCCKKD